MSLARSPGPIERGRRVLKQPARRVAVARPCPVVVQPDHECRGTGERPVVAAVRSKLQVVERTATHLVDDPAWFFLTVRAIDPALRPCRVLERAAEGLWAEDDALAAQGQGVAPEEAEIFGRASVHDPARRRSLEVPVPEGEDVFQRTVDDRPDELVWCLDDRSCRADRSALLLADAKGRARSRALGRGSPGAVDEALVRQRDAELLMR